MAHTIKLKFGSPSSYSYIDLTDSSHGNIDYYPRTASADADDITESGAFRVAGSSVADLIAKINEIESVFYKARVYDLDQNHTFRAFLTMQPDGVAETWESQIYDGRLELTDNVFGSDWANRHTDVVLIWRRAPYWERYVQIPISNSNGSGNSTVVYNFGDAWGTAPSKQENWINIAADVVGGDLPAPTAIVYKFNYFDTPFQQVIVNNNASIVTSGRDIVEGEMSLSTIVTSSGRSHGEYGNYDVPSNDPNGIEVATNVYLPIRNGGWLRYLLSASSNNAVRAKPFIRIGDVTYYGLTSVLHGPETDFVLYDLGLLHLPDGDSTNYSTLTGDIDALVVGVNLFALSTGYTVGVDYFQYLPSDYYASGYLYATGTDVAMMDTRNHKLIANTGSGAYHAVDSIGTMYGGIYLEPNKVQRLTFKFTDENSKDLKIYHTTIEVYAWLRKRTL